MRPRRSCRVATAAVLVAAAATMVSGCGGGSPAGQPSARAVPLVARTRVLADLRVCDGGEDHYCARELVVVSPHGFGDSGVLKIAERTLLHNAGWRRSEGQAFDELAADSPGDRLRVTYATAEQDLLSIDAGHIQRPARIVRVLSQTLFAREPALSMIVQAGSG